MTKPLTSSANVTTDSGHGRCPIAQLPVVYLAIAVASAAACALADDPRSHPPRANTAPPGPVTVTATLPDDILGGAPAATLQQAAVFAWQEFIALNWPANANDRGTPDATARFGARGPVVWETYRHKVEIFPGSGVPHGGRRYNDPPRYTYNPAMVGEYPGLSKGSVPPCTPGQPSGPPPLVNLDENSEIGFDHLFTRSPGQQSEPRQILFLAKANAVEYRYVHDNNWFLIGIAPFARTAATVLAQHRSAPPRSPGLVSFPSGSIEIKAAWRRLTREEAASGRFYSAPVRFYLRRQRDSSDGGVKTNDDDKQLCYVDEPTGAWGLVGLHIVQKTPTAPYRIYATFEQADNILDPAGVPLEDPAGQIVGTPATTPFTPDIASVNATGGAIATPASVQTLTATPGGSGSQYGLHFVDGGGAPSTPQGLIRVNQRKLPIPPTIVAVNHEVQAVIQRYNPAAPWKYYKLINVQYRPIDKPVPGQDYAGEDRATYYQANIVVETNYNLQLFSGSFQQGTQNDGAVVIDLTGSRQKYINNLITDFALDGSVFHNVQHGGASYNMGGCMGCHGNVQALGADFSFLLFKGPVDSPGPAEDRIHECSPAIPGKPEAGAICGEVCGKDNLKFSGEWSCDSQPAKVCLAAGSGACVCRCTLSP